MRKKMAVLLGLVALGAVACSEQSPTGVDDDLLPKERVTLEVRLPWDEFAANLEVFGGYGSASEVGSAFLAHKYGGDLEARALARFSDLPLAVTVTDTAGVQRVDDTFTLTGGRIVAYMDTLRSVATGPVTLQVGTTSEKWDGRSASWTLAVDTVGVQRPWGEEGAGPAVPLATAVWDRTQGDTAVFQLDSAQVEMLQDTAEANQGIRITVLTEGARLKMDNLVLRGSVIPSVRPDTVVDLTAGRENLTFVYSPSPETETGEIFVGGVPAWRTVLDVHLPASLTGPAALCAVASCPLKLTPDQISYAALVLKGRRVPLAYQPSDSLALDVRPVSDRSAMPKAPLGSSLLGTLGKNVYAGVFADDAAREVELPITNFVRDLLRGDSVGGFPPPNTLALLALFEPSSLTYASFFGSGSPQAPVLKLIITAGPTVELP